MPIDKFEDWMIGKKVKLVNADNRYGNGLLARYEALLGLHGTIVSYLKDDGVILVKGMDDDKGEELYVFPWRLELVNNEPLPLPG